MNFEFMETNVGSRMERKNSFKKRLPILSTKSNNAFISSKKVTVHMDQDVTLNIMKQD